MTTPKPQSPAVQRVAARREPEPAPEPEAAAPDIETETEEEVDDIEAAIEQRLEGLDPEMREQVLIRVLSMCVERDDAVLDLVDDEAEAIRLDAGEGEPEVSAPEPDARRRAQYMR